MTSGRSIIIVLILGIAIVGGGLAFALQTVRSQAEAGRAALASAQQAVLEGRDLAAAHEALQEAAAHFKAANARFRFVRPLRVVPLLGRYISAVGDLLRSASIASRALSLAAQVGMKVFEPFAAVGKVEVGKLSASQRGQLIEALSGALPTLKQAKRDLGDARGILEVAGRYPERRGLRREALDAYSRLAAVEAVLDDALPLLEFLPAIAGYPEPATYLFVLQNSDEMRPTGGFIGTVGVLTLEAGHITNFLTDDVYNFDRFVPASKHPPAPAPIVRYLEQPRFYLRDANWSPDFSESAKQILRFYDEERAFVPASLKEVAPPAAELEGVIAIMPEAIRPLLELVGPIKVGGQTFTAQNLTDLLEYQVEIGFSGQGIPRPQRKAIIAELGHALIAKLFALPVYRWPEVLHRVRAAFDEKHILLYAVDPAVQEIVLRNEWAGHLGDGSADYLAVVDANMFALKTDPYVQRSIAYRVEKTARGLISTVELAYFYPRPGPFWKTKGYRTWTRIYVPKGSILVSASGAMEEEGSTAPGQVSIGQELGKTVFGAFLAVQVGERKTLRFTYRLPDSVITQVDSGTYEFVVQKQPGTLGHPLTLTVDLGKVPRSWEPRGLNVERAGEKLTWSISLRRDQMFSVEF